MFTCLLLDSLLKSVLYNKDALTCPPTECSADRLSEQTH